MITNNNDSIVCVQNQDTTLKQLQPKTNILESEIPKKLNSLKLAKSFHRLGLHKKANRVWWCASEWVYKVYQDNGELVLHDVNFCRERLCPMCAARRSIKIFKQVSDVMDVIDNTYTDLVPIFLTLTLENCDQFHLSETLDFIFDGWNRLTHHRKIKRVVKGWFRALEVTFNYETTFFHPHIHCILLVDKSYFTSKDYMFTSDWVKLWRTSLGVDYDPICDIRKIKNDPYHSIAEVSKYTVKSSDYIFDDDPALMDALVGLLGNALKSRRLYAFGGIMKVISKQVGIKEDDLADGDLVNIEDVEIRSDIDYVLRVYRWNMGMGEYQIIDEENTYSGQ